MTASLTTLEDAIRSAVIDAGTNTNVIFHFPNAPRPAFPYTSIQYLGVGEEINDWDIFDTTDNVNKQYGFRDITFTINTYGDNARQEASQLQGSLRKQTIRDSLRSIFSASIMNMTPISDLTDLVDDEYEQRASFDILINANIEDGSSEDDTGYYDTVDYNWTNRPPV